MTQFTLFKADDWEFSFGDDRVPDGKGWRWHLVQATPCEQSATWQRCIMVVWARKKNPVDR